MCELGENMVHNTRQYRIAAGISPRERAARLGLKEQQIQRYEATQYASASLSRVIEVAQAITSSPAQHV